MMRKVKISEICPDWNIARGQMWFHFLTQKDRSDTQNQRIRPYFLGQKCRSRYSASIGLVHVPKLGLHSPTKPEGGASATTTRHDTTRRNSLCPATPDGRLRHPPTRAPHARGNAMSRSGRKPPLTLIIPLWRSVRAPC